MKIALNTYSLRQEWSLMTMDGFGPVEKLLKMVPEIKDVELFDKTFESDVKKLEEQIEFLDGLGIKVFSMGPHPNPLVGKKKRKNALKEFIKWIDIAANHDIHNFRVSLGGGKFGKFDKKPKNNEEALEWILEVLRPAVKYAEEKDVTLCIETHHKYSSNPDFQQKLLEALPSKNLGFIYDFGNFENDQLRWESLDVLIKKKAIKYMHAKCYKFDEKGFETTLDFPKAIKLMHDAGIEIHLSIEWEGKMAGPIGTLKTYELLKYSIAQLKGESYTMKTDFPDEEEFMDDLLD